MWYSIIATIIGALAIFILGKTSGKSKASKAEDRAEIAETAAKIATETINARKVSDEFISQKREELDQATRVGNFNTVLTVANELLQMVKEKK